MIRAAIGLAVGAALTLAPPASAGPNRPAPRKTQVADGVFIFSTAPYGDVGLDGNSVVILSREGVLVFDSNGTPAAAAAVLAAIREMTDQLVRYVVNSHWHWDHWYGTEVYGEAFPGLHVIAHEKTRRMMMGPALAFNRPGVETQLPGYIRHLEKRLATEKAASPPSAELPRLERLLEEDRFFLEQKTRVHPTFPDLTFTDEMDIYLGDRQVQLLHYDRAVTPGDTFLYLPKEKVLIAGDLLVNPISFALSCYPSGWLETLERMDGLEAGVIVPGHGEPLHDRALLHATRDVFRELLRRGKEARARGLGVDQARAEILPHLRDLMVKITRDDPAANEAFGVQLVDWYLHRVYDELAGPLSDDIAAIPES